MYEQDAPNQPGLLKRVWKICTDSLFKKEPSSVNYKSLKKMEIYLEKHLNYLNKSQKNNHDKSDAIRGILSDPQNRLYTFTEGESMTSDDRNSLRSCLNLKNLMLESNSLDNSDFTDLLDLVTICKIIQYNITESYDITTKFNLIEPISMKIRSHLFK